MSALHNRMPVIIAGGPNCWLNGANPQELLNPYPSHPDDDVASLSET